MKYKLFQAQKEFFPIMPQAKLNSRWQRCNFLSSYSCTFTLPNLLIVKQNKPMKYKLFQAQKEFFPIMRQAKLNSRWQRCNFLYCFVLVVYLEVSS